MESEFRLHHGSATTEKAAAAAGRVEAIVGDVVNGNRKAWGRIDVEDVALLVQHARDAAASPDWLSKMAVDALVTRWETAKAERDAAVARAEASEHRADIAEEEAEDVDQRRSIENEQTRDFTRCVAQALSPGDTYVEIPAVDDLPDLIAEVRRTRERAEAAEVEAERLRGLLSAERDGYAAGVADGRKAGGGEERDLIVACLRDFEKNGPPGLLSGAAQHIEAGCHWPDPLKPVWWQG
jgi:flagellar biosynthesis/type III secretory pathway protein FliH